MNSAHLHFVANVRLIFMTFYDPQTTKRQSLNCFTLWSLLHYLCKIDAVFSLIHTKVVVRCSFIFRMYSNKWWKRVYTSLWSVMHTKFQLCKVSMHIVTEHLKCAKCSFFVGCLALCVRTDRLVFLSIAVLLNGGIPLRRNKLQWRIHWLVQVMVEL